MYSGLRLHTDQKTLKRELGTRKASSKAHHNHSPLPLHPHPRFPPPRGTAFLVLSRSCSLGKPIKRVSSTHHSSSSPSSPSSLLHPARPDSPPFSFFVVAFSSLPVAAKANNPHPIPMGNRGNVDRTAVLTAPLSFDGESQVDYRAPNLLQRILSLLRNVRPGSDLTNFQLPPLFNIPKSQLQCFGEPLYCTREDMLSACCSAESPLERLTSVVAWSISITRPLIFGVAPYNPILGETHHVSRGNLNVLLEQVSHHPPVSALHATDDREELEMIWCQHPVPKFCGASVETEVHGKRQLKLLRLGETYVMNSPKLLIRFFPVPGVDWVGNVRITCQGTGLGAELCYRGPSLMGRNRRSIKGKIMDLSSSKTLYEVDGHWDSTVTVKDVSNGKQKVIYNAAEIISGSKTPQVKDSKCVLGSESAVVWSEVSLGILSKDWDRAREAKKTVEEEQRKLKKERDSKGETWVPKHFTVSYDKKNGWDCLPIEKSVPSAPIHVPFDC